MDNLELALGAADDEGIANSAVGNGVRGIHRQLTEVLFRNNVRGFTSVGQPFDPARHEAMAQSSTDEVPVNHVSKELRRGYMMGDTLFRPAQVMVNTKTGEVKAVRPSGGGSASPRKGPAQMSAASRPSWLVHRPESTSEAVYVVGRIGGVRLLEKGKAQAADMMVPEIFEALAKDLKDGPYGTVCGAIGKSLRVSGTKGGWERLTALVDNSEGWLDDYFWERVSTEIGGTAYEIAVLGKIDRAILRALFTPASKEERWSGAILVDQLPLLSAFTGGDGALIHDMNPTSPLRRAGMETGDVIVKVANRDIADAATARRTLVMCAQQRRPLELTYRRGPGDERVVRVQPRVGPSRR